jgi:hypothetical protein
MSYRYFTASIVDKRDAQNCYQYSLFRFDENGSGLQAMCERPIGGKKSEASRLYWVDKIPSYDALALFPFGDATNMVNDFNATQPEFL